MRKIERQMVDAILDCRNWKSENTEVQFHDGTSFVFLHGNCVAQVRENSISLFDGSQRSNTTKSRLNAILSACGTNFDSVFQKDFQWFFHDSQRSVDVVFENGMTVS